MNTGADTRTEAHDDRLVYSVAEAGVLLGISRAFAYELVARAELPVICLGRRRLVPKAALRAFIDGEPFLPRNCGGWCSLEVHRSVHTPGQRPLDRPRRAGRQSGARAVKLGEAEVSDASGAGP